jgi:rare lipoprotein A
VKEARALSGAALLVSLGFLGLACGGGGAAAAEREPARSPVGGEASGPPVSASKAGSAEEERGKASYYSDKLAGRSTASGEPYKPAGMTAAHRTLPFGTVVEVRREDGRRVEVRINDRGPFTRGRVIDLSRRAAEELGMIREGVVDVIVRVIHVAPEKPKRRRK